MDDEKFLTENTYPFTWDFVDDSGDLISISTQNQGISNEQLNQAINNGLDTINISGDGLKYILTVNGKNAGEINIPKDQFLKNVVYNKNTKALAFTFETSDGVKTTTIDLSDLADMYSAGNGIKIENGVISCTYVIPTKISELTNDVGYLTEHQSLVDYATIQWVEDKDYLTEHQDISNLATKEEVNAKADKISLDGVGNMAIQTANEVDALNNDVISKYDMLSATVSMLSSKVDGLYKTNTEVISIESEIPEMTDGTKDYIIAGTISEDVSIVANSITLKNSVSDGRLTVIANDIEVNNTTLNGNYPQGSSNTMILTKDSKYISFKDTTFVPSKAYNAIEIAGEHTSDKEKLPKSIIFDNCDFGEFGNNVITVFGTDDNAIITLNNCHFGTVSNVLRLSNRGNASGVIVNINNCTVEQWDQSQWAGFLICEDYTSKTADEANANNLFGNGKIKVNFTNLKHKGKIVKPTNIASVCGVGNADQVAYVYYDNGSGLIPYNVNKYPIINFI